MFKRLSVLLLLVLAAACGDDAPAATTAPPETTTTVDTVDEGSLFPVEVRGVTIEQRPERIVSGTATHTEILFAMGAGEQIVAVDLWSDHPGTVADLPRFDAFDVSVEAMAGLDPDLVIVSFDPGGVITEGMGVLGVPVLVLDAPDDLEGIFAQYADIGRAVGRVDEAATLVSETRDRLMALADRVRDDLAGATYYHELDTSHYTTTSNTYLGSIYGVLGLTSIADSAGGGPWPQLNAEFILESDPDLIFLAHSSWSGEDADAVAARPGWASLSAVMSGRVFEVDESLSSRWGPRIVDYLESVVSMALEAAG